MARRILVIAALTIASLTTWAARTASAQSVVPAPQPSLVFATQPVALFSSAAPVEPAVTTQYPRMTYRESGSRPLGMASLYASTALMQVLDVHSSLKAFSRGAVEGNPMMAGVAKNKSAFIAVKGLVAASTIMMARQIAKRSKVAAIITMAAVNSAYAMVVSHNYKLAKSLR